MALPANRPSQYQNPNYPGMHEGIVVVTGSKTIDLGLSHNNFNVSLSVKGGLSAVAASPGVAWDYGSKKGTFVITTSKRPSGFGDWIAGTVAVTVSFFAVVSNAVMPL